VSLPDDDDLPPEVEGASISGTVTDFDGLPLVGVRVEAALTGGADLDLLPVLSDGDGHFELAGLAEGRYDLRFVLGQVRARTLAVPTGTDQLRVSLARPQGILLKIKTPPAGPLPAMFHVVLDRHTSVRGVREHIGRTLRPRLLLWSIRPGTYTVTVWGGPYLPVVANGVVVEEGQAAPEVEVLLATVGGAIEGQVLGGRPPDGLESLVSWRRLDAPGHWPRPLATLTTDVRGNFAVRGLPTGRYLLSAHRQRTGFSDLELSVEEGRTETVRLELA
jgi:hypothetical protein